MDINDSSPRRHRPLPHFRPRLIEMLCVVCCVAPLDAQQPGWSGSAQGSGNALFGAAHTRLLAGTLELGRADSTLQVRSSVQISYGDDRTESNDRTITARTTTASVGLDVTPFARYSPFWFGSFESSLQQRIAQRYGNGLGGKVTFVRRDATGLDLSLALLIERTRSMAVDTIPASTTTLSRWSLRVRVRHRLTASVGFRHVTYYQPAIDHPGSYTIDTLTELEDHLWAALSFTASVHDVVDSEARRRGATSIHDGQLLFGLRASF